MKTHLLYTICGAFLLSYFGAASVSGQSKVSVPSKINFTTSSTEFEKSSNATGKQTHQRLVELSKTFKQIFPDIYISNREVANIDITKEYMNALAKIDKRKYCDLRNALKNKACWRYTSSESDSNEINLNDYFYFHKEYNNHPVVCLNIQEINSYCNWLTYASNNRYLYRLPTRAEWLAAFGVTAMHPPSEHLQKSNLYRIQAKKNSGTKSYAGIEEQALFASRAVNSDQPDAQGMYHMIGNVAEIVKEGDNYYTIGGSWESAPEDIRFNSFVPFEQNCTTGFRLVREKIYRPKDEEIE